MIRIALAYATLLIAVIAAADTGLLPRFAEQLHQLPHMDKVVHFLMYGMLALLVNLAMLSYRKLSLTRTIAIGCLLVLVVATAEEYSNQFVDSRDLSTGDLLANYLGILSFGTLPAWQRQVTAFAASISRR